MIILVINRLRSKLSNCRSRLWIRTLKGMTTTLYTRKRPKKDYTLKTNQAATLTDGAGPVPPLTWLDNNEWIYRFK